MNKKKFFTSPIKVLSIEFLLENESNSKNKDNGSWGLNLIYLREFYENFKF